MARLSARKLGFDGVCHPQVYLDEKTRTSRGFGFVSYSRVEEAEYAIKEMNGFYVEGKRLKVQRKRERGFAAK